MAMMIKKSMLRIFFLAILFLVQTPVWAQNAYLRFAEKQKEYEDIRFAAQEFERSFAKKKRYPTAVLIAKSYDRIQDYEQSFKWWGQVIGFEESVREDFYQYMLAARKAGHGNSFEELLIGSPYKMEDFPEVDREFLDKIYSKSPIFKLSTVDELNSDGSDYGLVNTGDGKRYFASDRGEVIPSKKRSIRFDAKNHLDSPEKYRFNDRQYFSIYSQEKEGDEIKEVVSAVPGTFHFSDPYYVKEDSSLFFSITKGLRKVKKKKEFTIYPELYFSRVMSDGQLSEATRFPFNDSLNHGVITPFVDSNSRRLYFSSNMEGGFGGYDLYYIPYEKGYIFGEPVNLGPTVNTAGNERDPFINGDRFYFSSDGHKGMGGLDVFEADFIQAGIANIRNMGVPVNSLSDDFAFKKLADGKIYLSSNRPGGMGMDDIYSVEDVYKQFLARVIDCNGLVFSESYLTTLRDRTHNGNVLTARNSKGEITAALEPETDFDLSISKPGYFTLTDQSISTKGFEGDTIRREYKLIPIPYQLPVHIDIVYYDLDKFVIRKDAMPALDKVAEIMTKYSFLDLLVGSHTDSRASDEYNIILSNNRAKAVAAYLENKGIANDRVRLEWFGESVLTNQCEDGKLCPEFEHQLNRRSELILEAFPDPTKQYDVPKEFLEMDFCDPEDIFRKLQEEINDIPTIYFDFDKSMLRSVHRKELERVSIMMGRMKNLNLYIQGHTDQRGSEDYNIELSERRAKVVKDYLIQRGVDSSRMESEWFGKTKPVHNCDEITCTPAMHQLNRRTELKVGFGSIGYTGRQKKVDTL
jgi:outer membrane protein OmpA-like peptidoglycan-associated protein